MKFLVTRDLTLRAALPYFLLVWFPLVCLTAARAQPPNPAGALDSERKALFRDLSIGYVLDGTEVHVAGASLEDLARLAHSSDPFVKGIAQQMADCSALEKKANEALEKLASHKDQQITAEDEKLVAGLIEKQANGDALGFAHQLLNFEPLEKMTWANAVRANLGANVSQIWAATRRVLVRDAHEHPRGTRFDSKSFTLDFTSKDNSVVVLRLRNETGRILHDCLVVADVTGDGRKVDADDKAHAIEEGIANALMGLADPGAGFRNARAAFQKAAGRVDRSDHGVVIFLPEWKPGQRIEAALIGYDWIRFANPGELTLSANEGWSGPMSLSLEEMTIACGRAPSRPGVTVKTPAQAKEDEEVLRKQHETVYITTGNGVILYQFLAYPGVWSEAAVAPEKAKGFRILCEAWTQIQLQVDNQEIDPTKAGCLGGSKLRFRAVGDKPVPVAVRFVTREFTADEKASPMPAYPPPHPALLSPDRQALRDALIAFLKNGPAFTGTQQVRGSGGDSVQAKLVWDDKLGMASGWISFPNWGNKKAVEGRIVDDLANPPFLQLVETQGLETGTRGISVGWVYSLHIAPDGASLEGLTSYHANTLVRYGQDVRSGTVTLTANRPR